MNIKSVAVIGHPFIHLGTGEQVRALIRSLDAVRLDFDILDVNGTAFGGEETIFNQLRADFFPDRQVENSLAPVAIFNINADEVDETLNLVQGRLKPDVLKIICPAWELSSFPQKWISGLQKFDAVWAFSNFIRSSLAGYIDTPIPVIGQSAEDHDQVGYDRALFGLPESPFIFLTTFELSSYLSRKNTSAVVDAFDFLVSTNHDKNVRLAIKTNTSKSSNNEDFKSLVSHIERKSKAVQDRILFVDRVLNSKAILTLINSCDAMISLHRSEGFGRTIAEAMALGRPAIATGYSGNVDFTLDEMKVRFKLIPVKEGEYPFFNQQHWAEPDTKHAAELMGRLVNDGRYYAKVASQSKVIANSRLTHLAVGQKLREELGRFYGNGGRQ